MWKDSCPAAARPLIELVACVVSEMLSHMGAVAYNEHVDALGAGSNNGSDQG
jgi:hypothetical protein